jgi:hypothetical protein
MMRFFKIAVSSFCILFSTIADSQNTQEDDLGAWYMYFYNAKFKESRFGIQGDVQYRNFNLGGDLEQLLLRSGVTYTPENTNITLTLGFANITTGILEENKDTSNENRIYQEALLPQKVGNRIYLTHRFRYEQRFVDNQDFRTRYRYNLFMNIPLNKKAVEKDAIYLALYNEIFINGESTIGMDRKVGVFDRNRFYTGFGYGITNKMRVQLGFMNQSTENSGRDQLQISVHHNF